ncbi:tRNA (cytidine(34)-2'-O)-methyltransferase [Rhodovibrio salinarum]|uniref:tRNA (cytidine(34)-2'-O)-methyltransferase n=1 Tax=Rhodovibrio salinarum TaxID=1087 RepID=A0A934QJ35_9PROT|nr:tRNA (cytidine(34)-2'-O)-methyltransferase [Rhodovibrio salinarum]MBK1697335.1 tRNA (cytidine(34)-2'-O)-methyltransferase [Rhodovibrio salinarum]
MRLALYEPDIPQNTGTILRLAACLELGVDLIEPLGFQLDDKRLKRAGMDYVRHMDLRRHGSFDRFLATEPGRLVLLTTHAATRHVDFEFRPDDVLLLGRESAGVPQAVHDAAGARVGIPLAPGMRSLNVALAAAMVAGEALRQTGGYPAAQDAAVPPCET